MLGTGAVMSGLRRLKSDGFFIDDAVSLDSLKSGGLTALKLMPLDAHLEWMPRADIVYELSAAFKMGQNVSYNSENMDSGALTRVYSDGIFLGIGLFSGSTIKPKKVLS